jgi:hypothetical protein
MKHYATTTIVASLLATLIVIPSAHAAPAEWTTAASACVPDESSEDRYNLEQARFEFRAANIGQIVARCNITNPLDSLPPEPFNPLWNCMLITYDDPDGFFAQYRVQVQLRLTRDTNGASTTITTFDSNLVADSNPEPHCFKGRHNFNFLRNAYYLTLILDRENAEAMPRIMRVRLYEDKEP